LLDEDRQEPPNTASGQIFGADGDVALRLGRDDLERQLFEVAGARVRIEALLAHRGVGRKLGTRTRTREHVARGDVAWGDVRSDHIVELAVTVCVGRQRGCSDHELTTDHLLAGFAWHQMFVEAGVTWEAHWTRFG
jgi:hypothetical protein